MTTNKHTRKPEFRIDFVGFSSYTGMTEVALTVNPEYDVKAVVSSHIHEDGSRLITLVFRPTKPELGRRGYSLKQEWEQKPQEKEKQNESSIIGTNRAEAGEASQRERGLGSDAGRRAVRLQLQETDCSCEL